MRALVLPDFNATPALGEVDLPEPGDGEVRVRVHAASLNGFDLAEIAGWFTNWFEHRFPLVLGKDFAGTVDALGPGVSDFAVGDRVFGVVTKPWLGDGSLGEFVTVPTAVGVASLPDSIGFEEGAALGLAGSAALACVAQASLDADRTVFVVGATGGVGQQVVQLASATGARIIATAHTEADRALLLRLGAHEVVDHEADAVASVLTAHPQGVDVVMHLAGDAASLLPAVRDEGTLVSTLVTSPDQLPATTATLVTIYANPTPEVLAQLASNQATQRTRVTIQHTYPLDEVADAFSAFAAGTHGKLVVTIP
ncbi:MAG TPA: NADP-dependent oxidoreductase [Dermatophilaceae bacterium]|nr:NADP-dependent oxidoreductase [Dermatophilaceae bacterium]